MRNKIRILMALVETWIKNKGLVFCSDLVKKKCIDDLNKHFSMQAEDKKWLSLVILSFEENILKGISLHDWLSAQLKVLEIRDV